MRDWNVIVTVHAGRWNAALRLLRRLGRVAETGYFNVLVVHADDPRALLAALDELAAADSTSTSCLARVAPVDLVFSFSSPEEFAALARAATAPYASAIAGRSFHVRIHRRGFKGRLSGHAEARILAEALLADAEAASTSARIDFEDSDLVIAIETVGSQAGVALLTRDDLARHPLLRPG